MAIESTEPLEARADAFLAAIRDDRPAVAREILAAQPEVAAFSIYTACASADPVAVAGWLARDRALATAAHRPAGPAGPAGPEGPEGPAGPEATPPLIYACMSRVSASGAGRDARTEVVRLLIDHGADPKTSVPCDGDASAPLPALYFACDRGFAGAARLLLEHGADPNDGESVYHGAQRGHVDCLKLLLEHGAKISARHPHWNNTPLFFLAGHLSDENGDAPWLRGFRWLLEHGADPNEWAYQVRETPLHTIARNGACLVAARLLLDHGADPLRPRADGRSPYALAVRSGAAEMIALLRSRMAEAPALVPIDELIGACMRGDEPSARATLAAHPDLMGAMTDEDRSAFPQAAGRGLVEAVRLMVSLGFDLAAEDRHGGTPLHWAAWWGRPAVVTLLISFGAPINKRDSTFGSSPVAWAAHGSRFCRPADDEYCAIVEMLLDAGSNYETSINKNGQPPTTLGSERVAEVFARRGFGQ